MYSVSSKHLQHIIIGYIAITNALSTVEPRYNEVGYRHIFAGPSSLYFFVYI